MQSTHLLGSSEDEAQSGLNSPARNIASLRNDVSEVDMQRAHLYGLLANLLGKPLDDDTLVSLRNLQSEFSNSDPDLGTALASPGSVACRTVRDIA